MEIFKRVLSGNSRLKERVKEAEDVNQAFKTNLNILQGLLESEESSDVVTLLDMVYDSSFPEEQVFMKSPNRARLQSKKELVVRLLIGLDALGIPVMAEMLVIIKRHGMEAIASSLLILLELLAPLVAGKEAPEFTTDDVVDAMDFEWHSPSRAVSPLLSAIASVTSSPRASAASPSDSPFHFMASASPYRRAFSDHSVLLSQSHEIGSNSILDKSSVEPSSSHKPFLSASASSQYPSTNSQYPFSREIQPHIQTSSSSSEASNSKPLSSPYTLERVPPPFQPGLEKKHRRKSSSLRELFAEGTIDEVSGEGSAGTSSKLNSASSSQRRNSTELSQYSPLINDSSPPLNPASIGGDRRSSGTRDEGFSLDEHVVTRIPAREWLLSLSRKERSLDLLAPSASEDAIAWVSSRNDSKDFLRDGEEVSSPCHDVLSQPSLSSNQDQDNMEDGILHFSPSNGDFDGTAMSLKPAGPIIKRENRTYTNLATPHEETSETSYLPTTISYQGKDMASVELHGGNDASPMRDSDAASNTGSPCHADFMCKPPPSQDQVDVDMTSERGKTEVPEYSPGQEDFEVDIHSSNAGVASLPGILNESLADAAVPKRSMHTEATNDAPLRHLDQAVYFTDEGPEDSIVTCSKNVKGLSEQNASQGKETSVDNDRKIMSSTTSDTMSLQLSSYDSVIALTSTGNMLHVSSLHNGGAENLKNENVDSLFAHRHAPNITIQGIPESMSDRRTVSAEVSPEDMSPLSLQHGTGCEHIEPENFAFALIDEHDVTVQQPANDHGARDGLAEADSLLADDCDLNGANQVFGYTESGQQIADTSNIKSSSSEVDDVESSSDERSSRSKRRIFSSNEPNEENIGKVADSMKLLDNVHIEDTLPHGLQRSQSDLTPIRASSTEVFLQKKLDGSQTDNAYFEEIRCRLTNQLSADTVAMEALNGSVSSLDRAVTVVMHKSMPWMHVERNENEIEQADVCEKSSMSDVSVDESANRSMMHSPSISPSSSASSSSSSSSGLEAHDGSSEKGLEQRQSKIVSAEYSQLHEGGFPCSTTSSIMLCSSENEPQDDDLHTPQGSVDTGTHFVDGDNASLLYSLQKGEDNIDGSDTDNGNELSIDVTSMLPSAEVDQNVVNDSVHDNSMPASQEELVNSHTDKSPMGIDMQCGIASNVSPSLAHVEYNLESVLIYTNERNMFPSSPADDGQAITALRVPTQSHDEEDGINHMEYHEENDAFTIKDNAGDRSNEVQLLPDFTNLCQPMCDDQTVAETAAMQDPATSSSQRQPDLGSAQLGMPHAYMSNDLAREDGNLQPHSLPDKATYNEGLEEHLKWSNNQFEQLLSELDAAERSVSGNEREQQLALVDNNTDSRNIVGEACNVDDVDEFTQRSGQSTLAHALHSERRNGYGEARDEEPESKLLASIREPLESMRAAEDAGTAQNEDDLEKPKSQLEVDQLLQGNDVKIPTFWEASAVMDAGNHHPLRERGDGFARPQHDSSTIDPSLSNDIDNKFLPVSNVDEGPASPHTGTRDVGCQTDAGAAFNYVDYVVPHGHPGFDIIDTPRMEAWDTVTSVPKFEKIKPSGRKRVQKKIANIMCCIGKP